MTFQVSRIRGNPTFKKSTKMFRRNTRIIASAAIACKQCFPSGVKEHYQTSRLNNKQSLNLNYLMHKSIGLSFTRFT